MSGVSKPCPHFSKSNYVFNKTTLPPLEKSPPSSENTLLGKKLQLINLESMGVDAKDIVPPKIGLHALLIALIVLPLISIFVRAIVYNNRHEFVLGPFESKYKVLAGIAILILTIIVQQGFEQGPCGTDTVKLRAAIAMACFPIVIYMVVYGMWGSGNSFSKRDQLAYNLHANTGLAALLFYWMIMIPLVISFLVEDFGTCEHQQSKGAEQSLHASATTPVSLAGGYAMYAVLIVFLVSSWLTSEESAFDNEDKDGVTKYALLYVLAYVLHCFMVIMTHADISNERKDCKDDRTKTAMIVSILPFCLTMGWVILAFIVSKMGEDGYDPQFLPKNDTFYTGTVVIFMLSTITCVAGSLSIMHKIFQDPKKCDPAVQDDSQNTPLQNTPPQNTSQNNTPQNTPPQNTPQDTQDPPALLELGQTRVQVGA